MKGARARKITSKLPLECQGASKAWVLGAAGRVKVSWENFNFPLNGARGPSFSPRSPKCYNGVVLD